MLVDANVISSAEFSFHSAMLLRYIRSPRLLRFVEPNYDLIVATQVNTRVDQILYVTVLLVTIFLNFHPYNLIVLIIFIYYMEGHSLFVTIFSL